jgi:uncharacterized SAM-dependent methyltransferase
MSPFIRVNIHSSAQPKHFMAALRRSFDSRRIDPQFHYLSIRQSQAWLALHRQYSPFAASPTGMEVYHSAFDWLAKNLPGGAVKLLSLACGGADKERQLIKFLRRADKDVSVTVSDISLPLVLEGYQTLCAEPGVSDIEAVTLDILAAGDLNALLTIGRSREMARVVTCFGLMPNTDPLRIAVQLATLPAKNDVILVGANLVPESAYEQNTRAALSGYDNDATRHWLGILLQDVGFEREDGDITFDVEPCANLPELLQIVGHFRLRRDRSIELGGEPLKFSAGERLRLFFSNRYTPALLRRVFEAQKMKILGEWVSAEKNEGIIACGPPDL